MKFIETGKCRSDAKRRVKVMVSDEDYELVKQYNWQVSPENCVAGHTVGGSKQRILMHRFIMNAPRHLEVDHINGDRLDNRRSNLRLCTSSENKMNRGIRCDTKSGYKGVSWHKQRNKWTARIKAGNTYKHLGLFDDVKEAALAYNQASLKYHGEFAWLNPL